MALAELKEDLESLQASIKRSEIAVKNSVGSQHDIERNRLEGLYAERRKLRADIRREEGASTAPKRAYIGFSS